MAARNLQHLDRKLRIASRALGNAGLVHAFGHCSARIDDSQFLVCAPYPLKTLRSHEPGTVVELDKPLPNGVLGEVLIHQNVYKLRPEVNAICRIMPPAIMTLSTQGITPAVRHGIGAYFNNCIPLWDNPRLLRDRESASELAKLLGANPALVMRGNGAVVVGESLEQAVTYSWALEDSARIEVYIRSMGFDTASGRLNEQEIVDRQVTTGQVFERMWRFLTDGDFELDSLGEDT